MFHHFTIVNFKLSNGETKNTLLIVRIDNFLQKKIVLEKEYQLWEDQLKDVQLVHIWWWQKKEKIAEELLTKGYIEATPENIKEYFDAIIFSGRDNNYYEQQGLDYMNPNDCIPKYSITDYMKMLIQNHIIDENSFLREIGTSTKEKNSISTIDVGKRTKGAEITNKLAISEIFRNLERTKREKEILDQW